MVRSEIYVEIRWRHASAVHSIIVRSIRGGKRVFVAEAEAASFARTEDDRFAREQKHDAELYVVWATALDGEPVEDLTLMSAMMPGAPDLYFGIDAHGVPVDAFDHDCAAVEALLRSRPDLREGSGSIGPGRPGG